MLKKYRMVHVQGLWASQIHPHEELVNSHLEDFGVVRMSKRYAYGSRKIDVLRLTIVFGDNVGLSKYLRFFGWQNL